MLDKVWEKFAGYKPVHPGERSAFPDFHLSKFKIFRKKVEYYSIFSKNYSINLLIIRCVQTFIRTFHKNFPGKTFRGQFAGFAFLNK